MNTPGKVRKAVFSGSLLALWLFVVNAKALAQGCALCYTTAAAAGAVASRSLNAGILILLVPTLAIFIAVLVLAIVRAGAR